jgi:hypothetical protein
VDIDYGVRMVVGHDARDAAHRQDMLLLPVTFTLATINPLAGDRAAHVVDEKTTKRGQ